MAIELVERLEALTLDQTLGKAERHRSVVRPLARVKVERPALNHAVNGIEPRWRPELQCRPQSVAQCMSQRREQFPGG